MANSLNLRPAERRLLVVVGLVIFVVVNVWFVWPKFGDLQRVKAQRAQALQKLASYQAEIAKSPEREAEVRRLEAEGSNVTREDQAIELLRAIQKNAVASKVSIIGNSRPTTRTNEFFIEQSQNVNTLSGESQLVDFLYELGSGGSTIRVRDLSIRPEPQRFQLNANIKLVSSYRLNSSPAKSATTPETALK